MLNKTDPDYRFQELTWVIDQDDYLNRQLIKPVECRLRLSSDGIVLQFMVDGCEVGGFVAEVAYHRDTGEIDIEDTPATDLLAYTWSKEDSGNDPTATIKLFSLLDEACEDEQEATDAPAPAH
jgi:hypothetical protein